MSQVCQARTVYRACEATRATEAQLASRVCAVHLVKTANTRTWITFQILASAETTVSLASMANKASRDSVAMRVREAHQDLRDHEVAQAMLDLRVYLA